MTLYNTELMSLQYISALYVSPGCKYAHFTTDVTYCCTLPLVITLTVSLPLWIAQQPMICCAHLRTFMDPPAICYSFSHVWSFFCLWEMPEQCQFDVNLCFFCQYGFHILFASCSKTHFFRMIFFFYWKEYKVFPLIHGSTPSISHSAGKGRMHMQSLGFVCCEEFSDLEAILYFYFCHRRHIISVISSCSFSCATAEYLSGGNVCSGKMVYLMLCSAGGHYLIPASLVLWSFLLHVKAL